ncbi:hypothetical protein HDU93_005480 [Gonapodya sp. JEL0774]|nr:hypothetical protein HDU93_005480 [Gonapodya sp. JEL0774]
MSVHGGVSGTSRPVSVHGSVGATGSSRPRSAVGMPEAAPTVAPDRPPSRSSAGGGAVERSKSRQERDVLASANPYMSGMRDVRGPPGGGPGAAGGRRMSVYDAGTVSSNTTSATTAVSMSAAVEDSRTLPMNGQRSPGQSSRPSIDLGQVQGGGKKYLLVAALAMIHEMNARGDREGLNMVRSEVDKLLGEGSADGSGVQNRSGVVSGLRNLFGGGSKKGGDSRVLR